MPPIDVALAPRAGIELTVAKRETLEVEHAHGVNAMRLQRRFDNRLRQVAVRQRPIAGRVRRARHESNGARPDGKADTGVLSTSCSRRESERNCAAEDDESSPTNHHRSVAGGVMSDYGDD